MRCSVSIPLLEDPTKAFALFIGQDIDLFLYDMPPLVVDFQYTQTLPIFGPLFAEISGRAGVKADFAFGFDSFGLRLFSKTGNPADIAQGLFISDRINADGTGEDVPEVELFAGITAAAVINVVVAKLTVGGGITATIDFNFHDNDNDGKIRGLELADNFALGPIHIFDIGGKLEAGLFATLQIGLDIPLVGFVTIFEETLEIANFTLLDFAIPRPDAAADTGPMLGTMVGSELHLSTTDLDDSFRVRSGDSPQSVVVVAGGEAQDFTNVSKIVADAGMGNDHIMIDADVAIPASMSGGGGNDTLSGGGGSVTLVGGEGNDVLIGSREDDSLSGEGGNDNLDGDDGDDVLDGGSGNNTLMGGRDDDTITGGDDADTLLGGRGDDSMMGGGGNDNLAGERGDDTMRGGPGEDMMDGGPNADDMAGGTENDTMQGDTGSDTMDGGDGEDQINGGVGNDSINGAGGDDFLNGGPNNDNVSGGMGNDTILGGPGSDDLFGEEDDDQIMAGETPTPQEGDALHFIDGGDGDNTVFGDDGEDTITTGNGHDQIMSFAGDDTIDSGGGSDTVDAGAGDDTIDGGDGDNSIKGGQGSETITTGSGDDTITGGTGPGDGEAGVTHQIDAGDGDNLIHNDEGDDTIITGSGNDTVFASGGNDSIVVGDGDDFVRGGVDSDTIVGGFGADTIQAGAGTGGGGSPGDLNIIYGDEVVEGAFPGNEEDHADEIYGDVGPDLIFSSHGSDQVTALGGDDTVFASTGDDTVHAGGGNDSITAAAGFDLVFGEAGDDLLIGNGGNDTLEGGGDDDVIWGGDENLGLANFDLSNPALFELPPHQGDILLPDLGPGQFETPVMMPIAVDGLSILGSVGDGFDQLRGGSGRDFIFGGGDEDDIDAGAGNDYADGGIDNDIVRGGGGDDIIRGGFNDDVLRGNAGIDQLYGEDGRDNLFGDEGNGDLLQGQRMWGGPGIDFLYAWAATALGDNPVDIALEQLRIGDEMHGQAGGDFIFGNLRREIASGDAGNEFIAGDYLAGPTYPNNLLASTTGGADTIFGGSGEDELLGGGGNDELWGGDDSDRIKGQNGEDTLYGGGWIDILVLDTDEAFDQNVDDEVFDGHFGNFVEGDMLDDNATDILQIEGTPQDEHILLSQDADDKLVVDYASYANESAAHDTATLIYERTFTAIWRAEDRTPLVEQFRIAGLNGDDYVEFLQGPTRLDLADLSARSNDFVGVIDGGPGNDQAFGTDARDRLSGGFGSDLLHGFGGDDRLWGDEGEGLIIDQDTMFAGQGNDDLIGGQGQNVLHAWSIDPAPSGQYGVFVDSEGNLFDNDGDFDNDGFLDADSVSAAYDLEDTGLNRMIGGPNDDTLGGGTGLDFLFGNGGNDTLLRVDGSTFESLDGGVAGDEWKEYAKSTNKVWYVGGTNADDVISVDFVTEPGLLQDHHIITRLTNNNGNFTFDAQVKLDFFATDADGNFIWDPQDVLMNLDELRSENPEDVAAGLGDLQDDVMQLVNGLLPPEADFLAIIVDALDGDDIITVGPTTQKTVWLDGGKGNDHLEILGGNAILVDQSEFGVRNDNDFSAFALEGPAAVAGEGDGPVNGQLTSNAVFTVTVNDEAPVEVTVPQGATGDNADLDDLVNDIADALAAADLDSLMTTGRIANRIFIATIDSSDDASLLIEAAAGAAVDDLQLPAGETEGDRGLLVGSTLLKGLTIDNANDVDFYEVKFAALTPGATISLASASELDDLSLEIFSGEPGDLTDATIVSPVSVPPDQAEDNDTDEQAFEIPDIADLGLISGLTIDNPADADYFSFTLAFESAGVTGDGAATSEVLGGDAVFNITIGAGDPQAVTLTAASTADNTTFDDLLTDLNAALSTQLLGAVQAEHDEGVFTLFIAEPNSDQSLTVTAVPELGFGVLATATPAGAIALSTDDGEGNFTVRLFPGAGGDEVAVPVNVEPGSITLDLAGLAKGDYLLEVTATTEARYNLVPTIGEAGFSVLDLSGQGQVAIDISGLNSGETYFIKVESQNLIPTIYDLPCCCIKVGQWGSNRG